MRKFEIKRNFAIVVLAILMFCAAVCGVILFNSHKVSAENTTLEQIVTKFSMYEKQQVRYAINQGDPKGMRFVAVLDAQAYTNLQGAGYDNIEYGYFIMPEYYENKIGEINEANTFGPSAKYTWTGKEDGVGTYTVIHKDGAVPILDDKGEVSRNDYLVRGSVVGMFPQNLATKYTARMYIKATKGTSVEYKFATAPTRTASMIDIAIRAMDAGKDDGSLGDYITNYTNWYKEKNGVEPTYSYTVNYVKGNEIVDSKKVGDVAINTAINIEAVAPSSDYVLDSSKNSIVSGKVYADNDLTLTIYVKGSVALKGELFNEELYHFEKKAEDDAVINLGKAIGSVDNVKIGDTILDAESYIYDDTAKTLTITCDAVATLQTGDCKMTISNQTDIYSADVTVADVIVNSESELYSAFETVTETVSGSSYCRDYIILGNDIDCKTEYTRAVNVFRTGTFDGKGHVVNNLNVTKPFTSSLQSTSIFKNVAFINATNASVSGFFGADSGYYIFDNVVVVFKENKGGGLVNYSANNITFTNSLMIDLTAKTSTSTGYISRTYSTTRVSDFTNSYVISDKTPFQAGVDETTDIYTSALAMRVATNARAWYEAMKGVLPSFLDENVWSFDAYGNLYYDDYVVFRVEKEMKGTKNGGELFYFSKNLTAVTGYADKYVSNEKYNVTLQEDVGVVNAVSIAGTVVTGFSYANKVLSIPVSAVSGLANGVTTMEIDASTAVYKTTVTVATSVMYNGDDVRSVFGSQATLGASGAANNAFIVLDGDITWDWTAVTAGTGRHLYGIIDGKGYAISNMRMVAYPFQTVQGGSIIRNIAFLNTTYSGQSGFFCSQSGAITIENVAITINAGTCSGLVGSMTQNLTIEDTVVVCNGTSYGYMGAYDATRTLTLTNSYVVTTDTDAIKTPTSIEDAIYVSAKATVCSNLDDLLKKSNNLNSFDSYWSLVEGNLCFGGKVVVAKSAS